MGDAVPQSPARDVTPLDPPFAVTFPQRGKVTADAGSKGIMPLAEGFGEAEPPHGKYNNIQRFPKEQACT